MSLRTVLSAGALALLSALMPAMTGAQETKGAVTIVIHVDIIPSAFLKGSEEAAARILRAQEAATLHDSGLLSYTIFQQEDESNHFTIVETWRDHRDYQLHEGQPHTVRFRNNLQPYLGAPLDSREHHVFR